MVRSPSSSTAGPSFDILNASGELMESRIPEHHPLRRLFGTLAERAFTEKLGWPDCNVSDYISKLLVEFTHTDNLYRLNSPKGARVEAAVHPLYGVGATHRGPSFQPDRDV